jgi:hypothetical protein
MAKRNRAASLGQTGKEETIYFELDCLVDTVLGTIARMSDELATQVANNNYHSRIQNKFEGVDMEAFKALYAKRDVVTLSKSVMTDGVALMCHLAGVLREQAIKRPFHDGAAFVVNYWPYQLSTLIIEEYQKIFNAKVLGMGKVYMRSIPPARLTPKYCKDHYSMMVVYDYNSFLESNTENGNFMKCRIPEITMFAPELYFEDTLPSDQDMAKLKAEAMHPFKAVEAAASPLVELNLVDIKFFSAFRPRDMT